MSLFVRGEDWGPFFSGEETHASAEERRVIEAIKAGSMSLVRARRILESMDGDTPFYSRIGFCECLAAIVALYPSEVGKMTATGKVLRHLMWNAAQPSKVEWLLNGTRYRHTAPRRIVSLLPSGATSNESLHAEVNRWFDQSQSMHKATLVLKLHILRLAKLLSHNQSMYRPASKQMDQSVVLARRLGTVKLWTATSWKAWCRAFTSQRGRVLKSHGPLNAQVATERASLRAWKRPAAAKAILRRPAGSTPLAPKRAKGVPSKRTPFTLKRKGRVLQWGRG